MIMSSGRTSEINMKKLKIILRVFLVLFLSFFIITKNISADTVIDNGLNYLKSKQDATGRINTGFSAPSQWSSIAFASNGIDISTIKNPSVSLQDFLTNNIPSEPSAATDWETMILSIVATGGDPTNYGGTNYVTHLESFYRNNQIGDECSLNDDIFGLLSEIAVGSTSNTQIKQGVLSFLISKQDATDGGFGYSAPGCSYYSTSADMTGAAIQALVAAKNNNLTDSGLDNSIDRAKKYLLINQNSDGGFGYYGSSDSDSTGWVLMAFNVLDMKDATVSANTKNWLTSQQSPDDGGFLAFDYGLNKSVSNSTTTAQAVIALTGKSWILKIFSPSDITPTPTLSITATATPVLIVTPTATPIPTPLRSTSSDGQTPTSIPVLTATPMPTSTLIPTDLQTQNFASLHNQIQPTAYPAPTNSQILGIQTTEANKKLRLSTIIFFGLGVLSLIIHKGIIR